MPEFRAAAAFQDAQERVEHIASGGKLVPGAAAIIAVLAALATLFSNHNSVSGLEKRTLAGIMQTRAADKYNDYESSRIKIEVNQTLAQSGLVRRATAIRAMEERIVQERSASAAALKIAQTDDAAAEQQLGQAESALGSYGRYGIAATLFDVSIVLVSITALTRGTKVLFWAAAGMTLVGLGYFLAGVFHL